MHAEIEAGARSAAQVRAVDRAAVIHRWTIIFCSAFLIAIVINLAIHGYSYYKLPLTERYRSPLHAELKPGGNTGRMLGLTGSMMMISLLAYSVRTRAKFMRNWGKLGYWLHFHIFLGIAGPLLITFHTAFKLRGIVAISYWSMVTVALSGAVGRYLYAQIPRAISGAELEVKEITQQMESISSRIQDWLTPVQMEELKRITTFHVSPPDSNLKAFLFMFIDDLRWIFIRRRLVRFAKNVHAFTLSQREAFPGLVRERTLLLRRITFLKASHNLFKYWHVFHLPLAQTMYLTMVIHVTVAILTGYFWRT